MTSDFSHFDQAVLEYKNLNLSFTGEQFIPGAGVEISYEHFTRYLFAKQFLNKDSVVLDLGCGIGYGSILLAPFCKHIFALDRNAECIGALLKIIEKTNIKNITAIEADVFSIAELSTFENRKIDFVICHELIEHITLEQQEKLLALISTGAAFNSKTMFLVSTPEKNLYNQANKSHNQFHEHELTEDEFTALLKKSFQYVALFSQSSVSANSLYPLKKGVTECTENTHLVDRSPVLQNEDTTSYFIEWLDKHNLILSLRSCENARGVFLYAIASNSTLPKAKKVALFDLFQRNKLENIAIAAQELRILQTELTLVKNSGQEKTIKDSSLLDSVTKEQAEKIRCLLLESETLAAKLELTKNLLLPLGENPEIRLEDLQKWEAFGKRIAPNLDQANLALNSLFEHVRMLQSPQHRAVMKVSSVLAKTWIWKKIKPFFTWLYALKQSCCLLILIFLTCLHSNSSFAQNAQLRTNTNSNKERVVMSKEELKKILSPIQYQVTQENGTEPPFANEYWDNKKVGIYVDVVSGDVLFSSNEKFDSGTGWPSFMAPVDKSKILEITDSSHGMTRTEIRSKSSNSHLGHVFTDGPKPTGMRYCMNSAALKFIPLEELDSAGYGEYKKLFIK
jgi:peptide-methionine (R)-S-oxide reductase